MKVALGIRPEDIEDASLVERASERRSFPATVGLREDMGAEVYLHFTVDAPPVRAQQVLEAAETEPVEAAAAQTGGAPFIARVDRTTRAREGGKPELFVTTRLLHFFDLDSGLGIYGDAQTGGP